MTPHLQITQPHLHLQVAQPHPHQQVIEPHPRQQVAHQALAGWLEHRMSQLTPLPPGRVRLVGLVIIDPSLADPDTSARATWIGDGSTVGAVLDDCGDELDRFDAVAAVTWPAGRPEVAVVIVNP